MLLYADNEGNIIFENQFIVGITPISEILINEEALLSEKVLAKEWNNDEEDKAWDYLQKNL